MLKCHICQDDEPFKHRDGSNNNFAILCTRAKNDASRSDCSCATCREWVRFRGCRIEGDSKCEAVFHRVCFENYVSSAGFRRCPVCKEEAPRTGCRGQADLKPLDDHEPADKLIVRLQKRVREDAGEEDAAKRSRIAELSADGEVGQKWQEITARDDLRRQMESAENAKNDTEVARKILHQIEQDEQERKRQEEEDSLRLAQELELIEEEEAKKKKKQQEDDDGALAKQWEEEEKQAAKAASTMASQPQLIGGTVQGENMVLPRSPGQEPVVVKQMLPRSPASPEIIVLD